LTAHGDGTMLSMVSFVSECARLSQVDNTFQHPPSQNQYEVVAGTARQGCSCLCAQACWLL